MHDIAIVGGGLGGSVLAATMAKHGADVVVVERETEFRDRVRGESILPWGVAEIETLGLSEIFTKAGSHELPMWLVRPKTGEPRSSHIPTVLNIGTTPISISHPDMQEALLTHAADQGAKVIRGARATDIRTGKLEYSTNGNLNELSARLVVSTEGRIASARNLFPAERHQVEPEIRSISGLILDDVPAPMDANIICVDDDGHLVIIFPQGDGRVRAYLSFPSEEVRMYSGPKDYQKFITDSIELSGWNDYYEPAIPSGLLATFRATESWIDHPYQDGIALLGDAAAMSDPTFGQGLSLTLRDARELSGALKTNEDWENAGHEYADSHDRYWQTLHTYTGWVSDLFHSWGPENVERKKLALEKRKSNPDVDPRVMLEGPDTELTEEIRKWFFGED
jgi:menaquinone-9 beta-reductase